MLTHTNLYEFEDIKKHVIYKRKWHIFRKNTKNYQCYSFTSSNIMLIRKTALFMNLNIKSKNRETAKFILESSDWQVNDSTRLIVSYLLRPFISSRETDYIEFKSGLIDSRSVASLIDVLSKEIIVYSSDVDQI